MSGPRCEVVEKIKVWPYAKRCEELSVGRVRLFEADDTTRDLDLCATHEERAAGEYPDNIKSLATYR